MRIAVSGCLLGHKVRFDSGHKRDTFVMDELSAYAEYISFCPENMAFSNPRPSIKLLQEDEQLKVISNKTGENLRYELETASQDELNTIIDANVGGIIFKSKSPSCGLLSAKLYDKSGYVLEKTDGVFAAMCKERFPLLPMEEEGRLCDPWLRENFIMQLFAYDDFERFKTNATMKGLVEFHRVNKFMLQSKDDKIYRELGRIVGNQEKKEFGVLFCEYEEFFKRAIAQKSSRGKTRNVLEHMAGFLKKFLDSKEKSLMHEQIVDYANGLIPVIVPLSTIKLHATKYDIEYILEQKFLSPYPKELALRSDIRSVK